MSDPVIGSAHPDLARALTRCAAAAAKSPRACGADVAVGRYSLSVFLKRSPTLVLAEPRAEYFVMLRADTDLARTLGLPTDRQLDLFLAAQEGALNALCLPWDGRAPPLPRRKLALDIQAPDDAWVGHITTSGRFRASNWFVLREGA